MKKLATGMKPAIGWLILSFILLTIPGSAFPKENWLSKIYFDKWVHVGMFGLLVLLFCWGYYQKNILPKRLKEVFLIITIAVTIYGIAMEFVQENFIPNRSFDFGDIIADAVGSVAGYFLGIYLFIKKKILK